MRKLHSQRRQFGGIHLSPGIHVAGAPFVPPSPPPAAGVPLILYTDIVAGPTIGGENNAGCYLSLYGINFGSFADYGTLNHVLVGGVEVANYRCLANATGSGNIGFGNGVYETFGIQRLTVQIGPLGGALAGVALPITLTISGTSLGNALDGAGNFVDLDNIALTFTPQLGPIVFVSLSGNDANTGTIISPLRHLQTWNGFVFGGAIYGPASGRTTSNQIVPGTHIILRGGTYTDTSFNNRWADLFRVTGTFPNGVANNGPIVITSYPGPAGANAPEPVFWNGPVGSAGGINLADTARSSESTPWGTSGYCKYIHVSNLKIFSHAGSPGDAAPVNQQTAADFSRIVNCELSFPSNVGSPTSGGIAGYGTSSRRLGNYIHDIYDISGAQQNHGIYIGDNLGAVVQGELHSITAYNCITDALGGQSIMQRGAQQTETAPFTSMHHNWCQGYGKYGILLFDGRDRGNVWCNVTVAGATGLAGIVLNSDNLTVANGIYVGYNTIIGWKTYSGIYLLGGPNSGTARIQSNVVYQVAGAAATFGMFLNANGQGVNLDGNAWFDASGHEAAKPGGDATGFFADPLFLNFATKDYSPAVGSPLLNAGVTPPLLNLVTRDGRFVARPVLPATRFAIGAYEFRT